MSDFGLQQSLDDLGLFNLTSQTHPGHPTPAVSSAPASEAAGPSHMSHVTSPSSKSHERHHSAAASPAQNQPSASTSRQATARPASMTAANLTAGQDGVSSNENGGVSTFSMDNDGGQTGDSSLAQILSALQSQTAATSASSSNAFNLQDIQRLLAEKEQSDRLQNLQTALLKQQLEALQRARSNPQTLQHLPAQQQKEIQGSQSSIQTLLSALQSNSAGTQRQQNPQHQGSFDNVQARHGTDSAQLLSNLLASQQGAGNSDLLQNLPKLINDNAVLAQYGLITPPSSGGLNQHTHRPMQGPAGNNQAPFMSPLNMPQGTQPGPGPLSINGMVIGNDRSGWDTSIRHPYTPMESPAVTPASVFSNMSMGTAGGDQFFSPLTSPALHPQPSYYSSIGPTKPHKPKSGSTPSASPLTLQGKPGPLPRKNRSTTAEARANRQRPSPLIKPTIGSVKRKKDGSTSQQSPVAPSGTSTPSSRRGSVSEGQSDNRSRSQSQSGGAVADMSGATNISTFTPIMSGVSKPMDASPSEGAASTPSPIDLSTAMGPPASGKPMTPGSLMGIAQQPDGSDGKRSASRLRSDSKAVHASKASTSASGSISSASATALKTKAKGKGGSVTFASESKDDEDEEDDEGGRGAGGNSDSRRTSHKAAEQKRRDSLKYCFDELRGMLPPITLDEEAPGGSSLGPDGLTEDEEAEGFDRADVMDPEYSKTANRAISKVALLRHSNEWIIRLRNRLARRDAALAIARHEIEQLRTTLMANGIMPPVQHPHAHHQVHFQQPPQHQQMAPHLQMPHQMPFMMPHANQHPGMPSMDGQHSIPGQDGNVGGGMEWHHG